MCPGYNKKTTFARIVVARTVILDSGFRVEIPPGVLELSCTDRPSSRPSSFRNDSRRRHISGGLSAIDAVDVFGQTDAGEYRFLIPRRLDGLLDELGDPGTAPLSSDHHAGVEDQPLAGGFPGSRWLLIAASRSRAKSSSSVAVEPCSLARRRDSESRRT